MTQKDIAAVMAELGHRSAVKRKANDPDFYKRLSAAGVKARKKKRRLSTAK